MRYYGLMSGLPELQPGKLPGLAVEEFKGLLAQYCSDADQQLFHLFFCQLDLINFNASIQKKDLWMKGGHLTGEQVQEWVRTGRVELAPFDRSDQFLESTDSRDGVARLQGYWQVLYDELLQAGNKGVAQVISFEISFKNLMKSYMERKLTGELSEHYLDGGWFDRFAYRKLHIGDIQAEHPFLAAALHPIELEDPFEREEKILLAKWGYYDAVAFFDRFSTTELFSWAMKFLDVHKWQYNDPDKGQVHLTEINRNINNQIQSAF